MKNLLIAIGITCGLFACIFGISKAIDWLAHWNNDMKYYIVIFFVFVAIVIGIYIELNKDSKIEIEDTED